MPLTSGMTNSGITVVTWTALGVGATGATAETGMISDRTVSISGTFGGGTVAIQGSNDGTTWFTLNDFLGVDLTGLAANTMALVAENPRYMRPIVTGGAGTALTVILSGKTQ